MDNKAFMYLKDERAEGNNEQGIAVPLAMVVENDPDTMLLISVLLRNSGYNVIEASNGEKALALLHTNNPAIIFMDVQMPVMDGYTATRRIREMADPYRSIPIIGLVAGTGSAEYKKCRAAGMNDYISKPFRLEEILGKLNLPPAA
ncbi:response regulator [Agriterribacter sp.]|uniref:response regulator n=1 Tax=Agriterribacter sp. TaxID=2821509 RepID=UPI002CC150AD|nr:response regulator [Agriterribacter sp.]HRO44632.1 response regulator [Agriterribacter sp.]